MWKLSTNSGSLNLLEPQGPLQACSGKALPLPLLLPSSSLKSKLMKMQSDCFFKTLVHIPGCTLRWATRRSTYTGIDVQTCNDSEQLATLISPNTDKGSAWILPSSGLLRSVRWFKTNVSELPTGPILEGQAIQEEGPIGQFLPLKMEPIGSPKRWFRTSLRRVITQKTEKLRSIAAETYDYAKGIACCHNLLLGEKVSNLVLNDSLFI
jgi:hypothetical protein